MNVTLTKNFQAEHRREAHEDEEQLQQAGNGLGLLTRQDLEDHHVEDGPSGYTFNKTEKYI